MFSVDLVSRNNRGKVGGFCSKYNQDKFVLLSVSYLNDTWVGTRIHGTDGLKVSYAWFKQQTTQSCKHNCARIHKEIHLTHICCMCMPCHHAPNQDMGLQGPEDPMEIQPERTRVGWNTFTIFIL